jgi:hypothetical protein
MITFSPLRQCVTVQPEEELEITTELQIVYEIFSFILVSNTLAPMLTDIIAL